MISVLNIVYFKIGKMPNKKNNCGSIENSRVTYKTYQSFILPTTIMCHVPCTEIFIGRSFRQQFERNRTVLPKVVTFFIFIKPTSPSLVCWIPVGVCWSARNEHVIRRPSPSPASHNSAMTLRATTSALTMVSLSAQSMIHLKNKRKRIARGSRILCL